MPTAELIKPKSYNHLGRIWKQGEVVEITEELAAELEDNPRFRIRGFGAAREARVTSGKPKGRDELHEAIRDAADRLDPDNEAHYTVTGKPECQALSGDPRLPGHRQRARPGDRRHRPQGRRSKRPSPRSRASRSRRSA